jgi:CRISPR system Cascade subunit CasE
MFLSGVTLDPLHRNTLRLLSDVYAQHRLVMTAFPDAPLTSRAGSGAASSAGVLFRLEAQQPEGGVLLLVQSSVRPDWERTDTLHAGMVLAVREQERGEVYAVGERLRFRLRANPTVCRVRRDADGARQKPARRGLLREEEQMEWLWRRADEAGLFIRQPDVRVTPRGRLAGVRPSGDADRPAHRICCFTVDYDGVLTVTDPARLGAALKAGLGRGKAWGCGLLSLARM